MSRGGLWLVVIALVGCDATPSDCVAIPGEQPPWDGAVRDATLVCTSEVDAGVSPCGELPECGSSFGCCQDLDDEDAGICAGDLWTPMICEGTTWVCPPGSLDWRECNGFSGHPG